MESIDPFICTHMIYGFAGLNNETFKIQPLDEYNDLYDNWGKGAYDRYTSKIQFFQNHNSILRDALGLLA